MKPVNLLPADVAVAAIGGKPNYGMIGGAAAGFVAVIAVAGYFAFARVDSIKSEKTAAEQAAVSATEETTAVRSQIQTLGQPVVDSDKQLAQGQEQLLVGAYTERHDFVQVARELRGIMDPGGWYESVEISAGGSSEGGSSGVKIVGYMPTKELAASFNERVDGTLTISDATTVELESEVLSNLESRKPGTYWKFTLQATLVDTEAPFASGDAGGLDTGTTVGAAGTDAGTLELSLSPEPAKKVSKAAAKPKVAAKPTNPFDLAATAAAGGKAS